MQRVTITIDDELAADIDRFMERRHYANRSEAIRDLARNGLQQTEQEAVGNGQAIAALVYTYDHHARELPKRLVQNFHDHHDVAQATLHVHLDHETCLEVAVLKGAGPAISALADRVIAERGVRYGRLVPVRAQDRAERSSVSKPHRHRPARPRSGSALKPKSR